MSSTSNSRRSVEAVEWISQKQPSAVQKRQQQSRDPPKTKTRTIGSAACVWEMVRGSVRLISLFGFRVVDWLKCSSLIPSLSLLHSYSSTSAAISQPNKASLAPCFSLPFSFSKEAPWISPRSVRRSSAPYAPPDPSAFPPLQIAPRSFNYSFLPFLILHKHPSLLTLTYSYQVPARAAAAAAVARALASLPPHQRFNLSSSSQELSSIYGSNVPGEVIEELEEEFYEEVLMSLPNTLLLPISWLLYICGDPRRDGELCSLLLFVTCLYSLPPQVLFVTCLDSLPPQVSLKCLFVSRCTDFLCIYFYFILSLVVTPIMATCYSWTF